MTEATAPDANAKPPGTDEKGQPKKPIVATTKGGHAGGKVTVACKHPPGIIIRAFEWKEEPVPVFGGGVKIEKVARPTGDQVVIHGPASPFGVLPQVAVVGGYALTPDVDQEIWEIWLEQNKNSDLVKKHQIHAYAQPDKAAGWAKEHGSVRSGLEGINLGTVKDKDGKERPADARMPRGTPNITGTVTEAIPAR
jgi:hypothetical protein